MLYDPGMSQKSYPETANERLATLPERVKAQLEQANKAVQAATEIIAAIRGPRPGQSAIERTANTEGGVMEGMGIVDNKLNELLGLLGDIHSLAVG